MVSSRCTSSYSASWGRRPAKCTKPATDRAQCRQSECHRGVAELGNAEACASRRPVLRRELELVVVLARPATANAVVRLSRKEVEQRCWANAPDRHESWGIDFFDCPTDPQWEGVFRRFAHNKSDWSSEAILITILPLLHSKGRTWSRLGRPP